MNKEFKYDSDEFEKQAQRFIIPLYLKDELGNYEYSSTGTYIEYNSLFYLVCAAHAISDKESLEDLHWLSASGEMIGVLSESFYYKVFREDDIIIVDYFNKKNNNRNYFNLNYQLNPAEISSYFFDGFYWIGFPNSWNKLKKISKTKSSEMLKQSNFYENEVSTYMKSTKYFMMSAMSVKTDSYDYLKGLIFTKNLELKYKGRISDAPSLKGMSGGAFFTTFIANSVHHKFDGVEKSFIFLGIGLERNKDNIVKGVSKKRLIEIFNEYLSEHPLEFKIVDSNQ
ncbi:hypothetical protein [Psychrobacter nivimaris]|uniref:hypothetical protein n=1 Tax=Psychrobacter nivimaris TaxID=281738 RepID=UPI003735D375